MNGADVLLLVKSGTTYIAVGSQRDVTFEEETEEIDVSSKDGREKRVIPGRYSASVSLDALYVPDDTAYTALKSAMRNGETVLIQRSENGTPVEQATAIITSLSHEFPDQDAATIAVELTIDGAWSTA